MAALKERLSTFHRQQRLIYAEQFVNWTPVDWARVIFIDEFGIGSGDRGRLWVWRERGTRFEERNIATVSHTYRFKVYFIAW